jgi:hypothetical protein
MEGTIFMPCNFARWVLSAVVTQDACPPISERCPVWSELLTVFTGENKVHSHFGSGTGLLFDI